MRTQLVTPPIDEPLYLDEVRMHLRNPEVTTNDDELYRMIQTAREMVEHKTGYALLTQTWDVYLDSFPTAYDYRYPWAYSTTPSLIELPFPPLQSVLSVQYSEGATLQTIASTDYVVNTSGPTASLALAYGGSWPTLSWLKDSVVIRIKVGWVDAEFIPASIKNWMLLAIEAMDKNRGLTQEREPFMTPFADRLLDRYRVLSV